MHFDWISPKCASTDAIMNYWIDLYIATEEYDYDFTKEVASPNRNTKLPLQSCS